MTDLEDARAILEAAGVECAEVDQYAARPRLVRHPHGELTIDKIQADATILALARIVADQAEQLKRRTSKGRPDETHT